MKSNNKIQKRAFALTANSTLKKIKTHLRHPLIFPIFTFRGEAAVSSQTEGE